MNKRIIAISAGLIFCILLVCFTAADSTASAADSVLNASNAELQSKKTLEELSLRLASFETRLKSADANERKSQETEIRELAEQRYQLLLNLIHKNPNEVLRVALPAQVLSGMPAEITDFLEKQIEIEGELEVINECDEKDGRLLYFIKSKGKRFSVHFSKQPEENLLTGAKVKVKGVLVGDAMVVDEKEAQTESGNVEVSEAALPNTFGEQKVLVLLVNFQDDLRQLYTISQVNDLFFNASNNSSVTNYFREASYRQTWLTGDVYGYFTLPINTGDCSGSTTASYARQAASNAGINLSAYNKFVYVYPQMSGCSYGGRGTIGGNEVWINGYLGSYIVSHELGHNFGLYHGRALSCGGVVLGNNCTTIEYGNTVDTMGAANVNGHFDSYQKERLGWLNYANSPSVTTIQTSGDYYISALSAMDSDVKGLKILKSTDSSGRRTWYYVEARRPFGFDSFVSNNNNFMNGVIVTMNQESNGQENYMLDMTPETSSRTDAALTVNRSYTDSGAGVTITPLSVDSGGALVNVSFGTAPSCVQANPSLSITPSATQWIGAGASASYSVTVKNNNSSNCSNTSFNLQTALPSGFTAFVGTPVLNIAPGASATTTVQIVSPSGAANGFYSVGISATNSASPSFSASVTVNCAVYSSLGVAVSPSQTSYTRSQTVTVTAIVTANGTPMSGANVTFTMTRTDGSVATGSAVSGADGSATFVYRFNKKKDPTGTYRVNANAALNGVSESSSTSFEVR